jgi:Copper type II ascorbate-dependent monooxygenase, C-terminal domain
LLLCIGCHGGTQDVSLPIPKSGFQLATDAFAVAQGTEVQRCYFFAVPGEGSDPIWVSHIVAAVNTGSHHMNVFRVKTIVNLDGAPGTVVDGGECWNSGNWGDWPLVMNSQEGGGTFDWQLPDGVAQRFTPGEKLMLQSHFVNANTQKTPGNGKAVVNFNAEAPAQTPMELGTVFATDQHIRICPGDTDVSFAQTCRFARQPVTILGANGHFHSRGVKFEMFVSTADNVPYTKFYESDTWDDPPFDHDLAMPVLQNGGIFFRCTYSMGASECADPTDSCCATFGPHVETQEHCNAFVYYYPKLTDATCF